MSTQIDSVALCDAPIVKHIKHVTFTINHTIRRITVLSRKDSTVRIHVFGQHDTASDYETIKYHYPGVASDVKFAKLKRNTFVNIMLIDSNHRPYLRRMKLQDHLYFMHHHYAKYYVYGQVPAVMQKTNVSEFLSQLYVCAPIFSDDGELISVVTDYYVNDDNHCVLPITGDAGGVRGSLCLDGFVYVSDPKDKLTEHVLQIVPRIDVYITFDKKNVYINVIYNGETISKMCIRTLFAANVLII